MSFSGRGSAFRASRIHRLAGALLFLLAGPPSVGAQSLTAGALRGTVLSQDGVPVDGVSVTVEGEQGGVTLLLETNRAGFFSVPLLAPGRYSILAEQAGFQPLRRKGIVVSAGQTASVSIVIERRPPPIESVVEVEGAAAQTGTGIPRVFDRNDLGLLDRYRSATDVTRNSTVFLGTFDGREGLGLASAGLAAGQSGLLVDGVYEPLVRHPAFRAEPLATLGIGRAATDQAQVMGVPVDAEWRGFPGSLVSLHTRRGTNRSVFSPWIAASGSQFGIPTELNPGDSSTTSFQVGAVLSGAIVPDTAHYLLQATYQSLALPTAAPWVTDDGTYNGTGVGIRETIRSIASDSFGTDVTRSVSPTVRRWKGGSGLGRVDWLLTPSQALMARVAVADWKETNPLLGDGLENGAGTALDARDIISALALTSTGASTANELRAGFSINKRTWTSTGPTTTSLAAEGVAFGANAAAAARFDIKAFDMSEAFQVSSGRHHVKLGGSATFERYEQDYRYGDDGIWQFGSLDGFGTGSGVYYEAGGPDVPVQFSSTVVGAFIEDSWTAGQDMLLTFGLRYETQFLPKGRISANQDWFNRTAVPNAFVPADRKSGVSPRFGFVWDVQNRGEWVLRGGGGLYAGRLDPALFAEVLQHDGDVTVRRGQGTFPSWPAAPSSALAPTMGPALTFFDSSYRAPRTFKGELGITRNVASGITVTVAGSYHHTDYLMRREDLNRIPGALTMSSEGRPLYGSLVLVGGLLVPKPGSNRRFDVFDAAYALVPTGTSDYYELSATVERRRTTGLSLAATYTYSKTDDNVLGQRSADPADGLSPFPEGLDGRDWADGRSDFDVPHRFAATAGYTASGNTPITVGGRFRFQSGLPYTPGFRMGVDVNGDGSGNNDPVSLGSAIGGITNLLTAAGCTVLGTGFAERNSCREEDRYALDLHVSVGIPLLSGRRHVAVTVDAFNVASSKVGVVDRAAALVNPAGTLPSPGTTSVALPLIANPNFGNLLIRRDDPRLVRVGLRIDY